MQLLKLWESLSGSRTNYVCAAYAAVVALSMLGILDESTAKVLENLLIAAGGVTLRAAIAALCAQLNPPSSSPTSPAADSSDERPTLLPFSTAGKLTLLACLCLPISGEITSAQERPTVRTSMQLSPETRAWFKNPDGSCVQCSIGMVGVHTNDINAASLLWDTDYGPAVRGGSWPSRVESYCDRRGIKAWSVTASSVDETIPWMVWACRTGRFAAIGAGSAHYQTLYGYEPDHKQPWLVCNNNSTQRIDRYGDPEFRRLHAASGPWVVILERASSDPPELRKWWK